MPEEVSFTRKASGLVRGLNTLDVFGIGIMNIQPVYVIGWMFMAGLALFQGANLYITLAITVVFLAVPSTIVWGVLAGSMPRSGGDYIYNTRILHPLLGLVGSMGMILGGFYWIMFMATFVAQPGLQLIGQVMGWQGLTDFATNKWGMFACSIVLYIIAFCIVAFGWRIYQLIQRPLLFITTMTAGLCFLAMLFVSKAAFITHWNAAAATYHSLNYSQFIAAAQRANGAAFPATWNWSDTFGAISATFLLVIYGYVCVYVGGEVKRPQKSLLVANWLSGMITVLLAVLCLLGLYHVAKSRFLIAAAYNAMHGPLKGYNLPWDTSLNGLVFMGSGFNRVIGVAYALTWILSTIALFAVLLTFNQRVLFAWGMDRMGPKFFCDINDRWATPIKCYVFFTACSIVVTAMYILWLQSNIAGLVASGMGLVTLFVITGVSATLFPYRKRVQTIWASSPYAKWKVGRVPVVTIAGVIYTAFVVFLLYFSFIDSRTRDITWKNTFIFIGVWAFGVAWYYWWRNHAKRSDVSIDVVFVELPPE